MYPEKIDAASFSEDVCEFIRLLCQHTVKFLIVGGEAVIFYGHIRFTGDVDFFFDSSRDNVVRLHAALNEFWEGSIPGIVDFRELTEAGKIVQFGLPPHRIDGVTFGDAWANRKAVTMDPGSRPIRFHYIGLEDLARNKEVSGRPKDEEDLKFLRRALKN